MFAGRRTKRNVGSIEKLKLVFVFCVLSQKCKLRSEEDTSPEMDPASDHCTESRSEREDLTIFSPFWGFRFLTSEAGDPEHDSSK